MVEFVLGLVACLDWMTWSSEVFALVHNGENMI